jgi:hypothetical protein
MSRGRDATKCDLEEAPDAFGMQCSYVDARPAVCPRTTAFVSLRTSKTKGRHNDNQ